MIKVYKEFDAIQWNGENTDEITSLEAVTNHINNVDSITLIFEDYIEITIQRVTLNITDWLVFSPYKQRWKKYTNEEFKRDFTKHYDLEL